MIIDLSVPGFASLLLRRCRKRREIVGYAAPAVLAISKKLLPSFTGAEMALMLSILALTIGSSRIAREISMAELSGGLDDGDGEHNFATGLCSKTVRSSLRSLAAAGWLIVYRELQDSGSESAARVYEINFKRLDPVLGRALEEVATTVETAHKCTITPGANGVPPLEVSSSPLLISNYVTVEKKTEDMTIFFRGEYAAVKPSNTNRERQQTMASLGKRIAAATGSAAAVLQGVSAHHRDKRAKLVEAAATSGMKALTRPGLQAILDTAALSAALPFKLTVTTREFGFLRKRLQADPPSDLLKFLTYSLTFWATLSEQNHAAVRKDQDRLVIGRRLPPAPHFSTLAYWYPYFLRAYRNHEMGRDIERQADTRDGTVRRLQAELAETRSKLTTMVRRHRVQTQKPTQAPADEPTKPPHRPPTPQPHQRHQMQQARAIAPQEPVDPLEAVDLPEWR